MSSKALSKSIRSRRIAAVGFAALATAVHAAETVADPVKPGERLSDWMLRQPTTSFGAGTMWASPAERASQQALKDTVLAGLARRRARSPNDEETRRLAEWLQGLPVTGRVVIGIADPRWLQAHPSQDPVLREADVVRMAAPPVSVTVVAVDGSLCQASHRPGATAAGYLSACRESGVDRIDWAWVAQPDGRSARVGLAAWNAAAEDEVAPGAWIWAPPRRARYDQRLSLALIRFLATQGPAADRLAGAAAAGATPQRAAPKRDAMVTASDWGEIGLLQTPTARMSPAGEMRFHLSRVSPYARGTVMFQPFDWLEAGFRYTSIGNREYGLGVRQSFKDKSIDFKLRLVEESTHWPQIALGIRDLGGTGLFSSEYLVASKRFNDFDWSAGIGWGYLGNRGDIRNPLSVFGSAFDRRPIPDKATGGTANTESYFRGRAALFGGLQWRTPWDPLTLKVEVEGNDYRSEPLADNQRQRSPINFGAVYRYAPGLDVSAGIERGNRLMLGVTLSTDLDGLHRAKANDPPLPRFTSQMPAAAAPHERTAADIEAQTGWIVTGIEQRDAEMRVDIGHAPGVYRRERIERTTAVLHRDAPATVQRFVIRLAERGIGGQSHEVDRAQWIALRNEASTPSSPTAVRPIDAAASDGPRIAPRSGERFGIAVAPHLSPIVGGPDGFLLYRIDLRARGEYRFTESTWLGGTLALRLLDNYDHFKFTAPSELPRVRTFQREYATTSRVTLPNLQLTHVGQLASDHFYSVYGGLLESMFAGAGAEWLWRPQNSALAFGIDANRVRQREFEQRFGLRDYTVNTGHATVYWETGWQGVQTSLSVGQYLAGDRGATLDIARRFDNGVTLGAYATKTDVSSAQFGEGSFDKGIYLSIPFDAILPRSSNATGTLVWSPLTRDGGARLARHQRLFDVTTLRDRSAFEIGPPPASSHRTGEPVFDAPPGLPR